MSLLFKRIAKADFEFPSWITGDAKDLIEKLLQVKPENRITLAEALKHPFLKGMSPTDGGALPQEENGKALKVTPSEYDLKLAVKALSTTGESENFDEDDSNFDEKEAMKDFTIFDIVANLTTGLNRIFMSKDHKTHVKRRVVFLWKAFGDREKRHRSKM